jgi:hypothetical protein
LCLFLEQGTRPPEGSTKCRTNKQNGS